MVHVMNHRLLPLLGLRENLQTKMNANQFTGILKVLLKREAKMLTALLEGVNQNKNQFILSLQGYLSV